MTDIVITPEVVQRIERKGYIQGWVPVVDIEYPDGVNPVATPKLRPWWDDPILRERGTGKLAWNPKYAPGRAYQAPPSVLQRIEERKAPDIKTTATHKFRALIDLLTREARRFTVNGEVCWPASVTRELKEAAWKQGKAGKLTMAEQVELLARTYIVHSSNRQKADDAKKVAKDGQWHYST